MRRQMNRFALTGAASLLASLGSLPATAHHSITANFDTDTQIEIRGTVVDFKLRSPHASLVIDGIGYIDGVAQSATASRWEIESSAGPSLRRRGLSPDSIQTGDDIVVIGAPSRRGLNRANSSTFLRTDGSDFADAPSTEFDYHPQFRARRGLGAAPEIEIDATGARRVAGRWQPPFQREGTTSALPLNDAGLAAWQNYDQTQSPANTCEPMSIPVVMNAPSYYVDVRFDGEQVVIRNQAYDIVRTVPLSSDWAPADPDRAFGNVRGRIEADVLVVESRNYPVSRWGLGAATQINGGGADVPSSPAKTVTERFSVGPDSATLTYEYTLFDPAYMREPHSARIELARVPDNVPMYPYDCDPEAARMFSRAPGASLIEETPDP